MDDSDRKLAEGTTHASIARTNRGWFRTGDKRINRGGRPRGSKLTALTDSATAVIADKPDHVMRLFVPYHRLSCMITCQRAPWIVGLPPGFEIVDCRGDPARGGVDVIVRSESYPRIARGTPIPEFEAVWNGLIWGR